LAKALGPRAELQGGLDKVYRLASERFDRDGYSGLGADAGSWLLEAMIRNQVDTRWEEIWKQYLTGAGDPERIDLPGHPFLPGGSWQAMRGLLGMPESADYWKRIARGVRDFDRRLLRHGYATLASDPNIIDELAKTILVIFDWWADPRAAQHLLKGLN